MGPRYTLAKEDYYELLAHVERVAKLRAEAHARVEHEVATAEATRKDIFESLAVKYHFDPKHPAYQLNDETLELIVVDGPPSP